MTNESFIAVAALLASWTTLTAGTWKLFENIDKVASSDAKSYIAALLKNEMQNKLFSRLAETFSGAFDSVFGYKLLSWNTFGKSCISTLFCVFITSGFWVFLRPNQALDVIHSSDGWSAFIYVFIGSLILSSVPDYISLTKTRYFIECMKQSKSALKSILLVMLDAVLSIFLGLIPLGIIIVSEIGWSEFFTIIFIEIIPLNAQYTNSPPFGIMIYASFFTSVWLWLYLLSSSVLRVGDAIEWIRSWTARLTDIENKPFLALGVVACVIETIIFGLLIVFFCILKYCLNE